MRATAAKQHRITGGGIDIVVIADGVGRVAAFLRAERRTAEQAGTRQDAEFLDVPFGRGKSNAGVDVQARVERVCRVRLIVVVGDEDVLGSGLAVCSQNIEEHIAKQFLTAVVRDALAVSADVAGLASDVGVCGVAHTVYAPIVGGCDGRVQCDVKQSAVVGVGDCADNKEGTDLRAAVRGADVEDRAGNAERRSGALADLDDRAFRSRRRNEVGGLTVHRVNAGADGALAVHRGKLDNHQEVVRVDGKDAVKRRSPVLRVGVEG